jgi:hypothetical protein
MKPGFLPGNRLFPAQIPMCLKEFLELVHESGAKTGHPLLPEFLQKPRRVMPDSRGKGPHIVQKSGSSHG